MQRSMRLSLAAVVAGGITTLLFVTRSAADSTSWATRDDLLTVQIQSDRATYDPGDSIKLRVSIRNLSSQTLNVFNGSPWHEIDIVVIDRSGNKIERTGPRDSTTYKGLLGGGAREIAPGQLVTFQWNGQAWSDLGHWGFNLSRSGTYTVRAVPQLSGFLHTSDYTAQPGRFTVGPDSAPNPVTIVIRTRT